MMDDLKKNELNEQEMENVTGGASFGEIFDAVTDVVGDAWEAVSDAAETVIDVVEHAASSRLRTDSIRMRTDSFK